MKESVTYQWILEEGRGEGKIEGALTEAKKLLRLLGEDRWGTPDAPTARTLEGINDLPRLEELLLRLPNVGSWQELLGWTSSRRASKRRQP
jgi:hypothetical protein